MLKISPVDLVMFRGDMYFSTETHCTPSFSVNDTAMSQQSIVCCAPHTSNICICTTCVKIYSLNVRDSSLKPCLLLVLLLI